MPWLGVVMGVNVDFFASGIHSTIDWHPAMICNQQTPLSNSRESLAALVVT